MNSTGALGYAITSGSQNPADYAYFSGVGVLTLGSDTPDPGATPFQIDSYAALGAAGGALLANWDSGDFYHGSSFTYGVNSSGYQTISWVPTSYASTITATATATDGVSANQAIFRRAIVNTSAGTASFYISSDGSNYTQVGSTVTTTAGAMVGANERPMTIGGNYSSGSNITGKIYLVKLTTNGTATINASSNGTAWVDAVSANTWTGGSGVSFGVDSGGSNVAPGQVTNLAAGTPTATTIPVTYTAPAVGTTPITYVGWTSPHGAGMWTQNAATLTSSGGTLTGLSPQTNYDLRIVATNVYGSSTTDLTTGVTTGALPTATSFNITENRTQGGAGATVTVTAAPPSGYAWPSQTLTPSASGLSGSWSPTSATVSNGSSAPVAFVFTPTSSVGTSGTLAVSGSSLTASPTSLSYSVVASSFTATRFDAVSSASSIAPSGTTTLSLIPNGNWTGGTATLAPTLGTISGGNTITLPSSGNATLTATYTAGSTAGAESIACTNSAGLANPWPVPLNVFASSSGSAQSIAVGSATTDPHGGRLYNDRTYQKDAPTGTPAGFGAGFNMGWGEVWLPLNLPSAATALYARFHDGDSGATTTPGTGTVVQTAVQVYGPLGSGQQLPRLLLPASDTAYYVDVAADSAMTNPVRIPWKFFVRDVVVHLGRSQEGGFHTSWQYGSVPGTSYANYLKSTCITSFSSVGDTSATDAWFTTPASWARMDGTSTAFKNTTDGNFYINSAASMEMGRLWKAKKGHGVGLCGVAVVDGYNATFSAMVGTDGTPCVGLRNIATSACGGKFRYFTTNMNDGGTTLSYGQAGTQTAINGLIAYFAANYKACAIMSIGFRSGAGGSSAANGTQRAADYVSTLEAADARVCTGDMATDWFTFNGGHPAWDSQVRYARRRWQSLMMTESTAFGGFGYAFGDRWPRIRSTGTRPSASATLSIPIDLPTGATAVAGKTWEYGSADGTTHFNYAATDTNDLIALTWVYPSGGYNGNGTSLTVSSVVVNSANSPPTLDVTLASVPSGTLTVQFNSDQNYGPYTPNGGGDPVQIFDNRDWSTYGIDCGGIVLPRCDITVAAV